MNQKSHFKNILLVIFTALAIVIGRSVWSQETTSSKATTESKQATEENINESNNKIAAGGILTDDRFLVHNFGFARNYTNDGKGETLDVYFDIVNQTDANIKLKFFIVSFYEHDSVDSEIRKLVEYPKWRKRDFGKEELFINYVDSVPFIDKREVYQWVQKKYPDNPDSKVNLERLKLKEFPSLETYMKFVENNPDKGSPILLQGMHDGRNIVKKDTTSHITMSPLRATIFSRLFIPYVSYFSKQPDFFNHVAVFIVEDRSPDEGDKEAKTEAKKTEDQGPSLVFRQIFTFKGRFKVY